jgi:integrase
MLKLMDCGLTVLQNVGMCFTFCYTKNSETAEIPLGDDLAAELQAYVADRPYNVISIGTPSEPIWPGAWREDAAEMIRADLETAGISYTDERGHDFDFHALRHQFITNLGRAGVPLAMAQKLARHSDAKITANIYTHLSMDDAASSVERMGDIPAETSGKRFSLKSGPARGPANNVESG